MAPILPSAGRLACRAAAGAASGRRGPELHTGGLVGSGEPGALLRAVLADAMFVLPRRGQSASGLQGQRGGDQAAGW